MLLQAFQKFLFNDSFLFWLCWGSVAALGRSLVEASGNCSLVAALTLLVWGFSRHGGQALDLRGCGPQA